MARIAVLVFVVLACTNRTAAQELFPLEIGRSWEYVGSWGGNATIHIVGGATIAGSKVVVRQHVGQTVVAESLVNYWSVDPEGDVYLHGFTNFTSGGQRIYVPPIKILDCPLEVGLSWSTETQTFSDLEGTQPDGDPFTASYHLRFVGEKTVPAGTFAAYEVVDVVEERTKARHVGLLHSLAGSRRTPWVSEVSTWYAPGIGRLEYHALEIFQLSSWGLPTGVSQESWSAVKRRYR